MIYSVEQIRAIEKVAFQDANFSSEQLMINAAKFCLVTLQKKWPCEKKLTIFCGMGKNGGDGVYLGLLAKEAGYEVEIVILPYKRGEPEPQYLSDNRLKLWEWGILPIRFNVDFVPSGNILVDALLGIGLKGRLRPIYHKVIQSMNQHRQQHRYKKILAIDVPSGMDADTGDVLDIAVKADVTATLIGYKTGLFTGFGSEFSGEVYIGKLNIAEKILSSMPFFCQEMKEDMFKELLPLRHNAAHKHDFGHVVVVGGGEPQFAGAGLLAANAALKAGVGLVSLIVPSLSYPRISHAPAELMCYAIDDFNEKTASFLTKADVIVIGPGLGKNTWSQKALAYVLALKKRTLYDADALNLIAQEDLGVSKLFIGENKSIFTPHPGEAAHLLNCATAAVQFHRFEFCKKIAEQYQATVVLKGAGSLIYESKNQFSLCPIVNSRLATAGTGDVLAGMIGSLWAQGLNAYDAARAGVWLHAILATQKSSQIAQRGFLASDIIQMLPSGIKRYLN